MIEYDKDMDNRWVFHHNIDEIMYTSFVAMHNIRIFGDIIFYRRMK